MSKKWLSIILYRFLISSAFLGSVMTKLTPIAILAFCKLKSSNAILAPLIASGIPWAATVQFKAKPSMSWVSLALFPCAFSMLIDFIGYFSFPETLVVFTFVIASTTKLEKKSLSLQAVTNHFKEKTHGPITLDDIAVLATFISDFFPRLFTSMVNSSWMYFTASLEANLNPFIIDVGWIFCWTNVFARYEQLINKILQKKCSHK